MFEQLINIINNFSYLYLIDIILIAAVFYFMYVLASKYNSSYLMFVTILVLLISVFIILLKLPVLSNMLKLLASSMPIIYIIVFRSELKRELWKRSKQEGLGEVAVSKFSGSEEDIRLCIKQIIKACQNMSKKSVGALIVIVPQVLPLQIVESGTMTNADLSSELVENIFVPNSPLHDGAMLVSGNKITACGCLLPLTQKTDIPKELGTRHRAAIGVTEMTDVMAIIVSEETGVISIAHSGNLMQYCDNNILTEGLEKAYGLRRSSDGEEK